MALPAYPELSKHVLCNGDMCEEDSRFFKSEFGVSEKVFRRIWKDVNFTKTTKPEHVLWGLHFLKCYPTEACMCRATGVKTRKTVRKWKKNVVTKLAKHMSKVVSMPVTAIILC
jgi:hypothetical protein